MATDALSRMPIELLERILLELPIQDLLINAQIVNKRFHDTIIESTMLQQALFLKPLPGKPLYYQHWGSYDYYNGRWNKDSRDLWVESSDDRMWHVVNMNPFFSRLWQDEYSDWHEIPSAKSPHASWRRMLVSQPPIATALAETIDRPAGSYSTEWGEARAEVDLHYESPQSVGSEAKGLTMGEVDSHCPGWARIGNDATVNAFIEGSDVWEKVEFAWEIQRLDETL